MTIGSKSFETGPLWIVASIPPRGATDRDACFSIESKLPGINLGLRFGASIMQPSKAVISRNYSRLLIKEERKHGG